MATPIKGSFTLPDLNGFEYKFMYNPPEFTVASKAEFGAICVPGASHPVYQYGSGGEEAINFDLFLDGERGMLNITSGRFVKGLDIRDEVRFLEGLRLPMRYELGSFAKTRPPIVIFNFGTLFKNKVCCVRSVSRKATQFTHDGACVKATVTMQMAVMTAESETFLDVLNTGEFQSVMQRMGSSSGGWV